MADTRPLQRVPQYSVPFFLWVHKEEGLMLGRPFEKLCHRFAKMQCKKPRGGGHRALHPGSGPHCFCSEFPAPAQPSCCFSGSGSGTGPHHAASGIARPRAAHGWGGAWVALSPPPRGRFAPSRPSSPLPRRVLAGEALGLKGPGRPPTWREGPARLPRLPAAAAAGRRGPCRPGRLLGHRFSTYPRG